MDLALAIDALVPAARYGGATTANDRAAFDALDWTDQRRKPTWDQIVAADAALVLPEPAPSLEERLVALEQKVSRSAKLEAALVEKGTISAEAIDAATIDEAATIKGR